MSRQAYVSTLIVSASLAACSPRFEPVTVPKPHFMHLGEYTIVKEISPVTARPLEELLLSVLNIFPDVEDDIVNVTVSRSQYPEILYYI